MYVHCTAIYILREKENYIFVNALKIYLTVKRIGIPKYFSNINRKRNYVGADYCIIMCLWC